MIHTLNRNEFALTLLLSRTASKSSLFNALTNSSVPAENYPFCTIDPSEARVQVPDDRFDWLVDTYKPDKITPAHVNINI